MIPETSATLRLNSDRMRSMLTAIIPPGEPFEIRVLKCRKRSANGLTDDPYVKAQSGYFTDLDKAVAAACAFTGNHAAGVHVTFNELAPHVLSWGADRIANGRATSDADVLRYRHLYVDVDPVRPTDTNATVPERDKARKRAGQVLAYLRDLGWPDPAWAGGSGSGSTMLFRIDLAPEDRPLYERVLRGLNDLFGDCDVQIDTSTANPARLVRLAGTVNAKAITPTPDRPWTLAKGQALPNAGIVTRDQLEFIAAAEPEPVMREPFTGDGYDLACILADSGIQYRVKQASYGTVYEIADCLTSTDHTDGACFVQMHSGAVAYRCLHARCSGMGWGDAKPFLTLPERRTGLTVTVGGKPLMDHTTGIDDEPAVYRLQTRKVSDIEAKPIEWVWPLWLPAGMLGLFAGYGGSGKSTVALHIAAACSVGGTLPDGQPAPLLNTLIFAAEDSPEHTIRPRLELMGANLDRIDIVDGIARDDDDPGWVQLRNHAPLIEQAVIDHDIGLVIIDPVSSFIGDANSDRESDVRSGITPLIGVAERTGAAILMIRHVSKGETSRAASRILGSTAWHDIPRVVWMLADAPDEHQPEPHEDGTRDTRRVLGVVKANLAAKPQARWCIQPADGPLRWLPDPSPVTIDECFTAQTDRGSKGRNAEEWLAERLAGGSQPTRSVETAAKAAGISERTLDRARASLNVKSYRDKSGWYMQLPPGSKTAHREGCQPETDTGHDKQLAPLHNVDIDKGCQSLGLAPFPEYQGKRVNPPDATAYREPGQTGEGRQNPLICTLAPFPSAQPAEPLQPTGTDGALPGEIKL